MIFRFDYPIPDIARFKYLPKFVYQIMQVMRDISLDGNVEDISMDIDDPISSDLSAKSGPLLVRFINQFQVIQRLLKLD